MLLDIIWFFSLDNKTIGYCGCWILRFWNFEVFPKATEDDSTTIGSYFLAAIFTPFCFKLDSSEKVVTTIGWDGPSNFESVVQTLSSFDFELPKSLTSSGDIFSFTLVYVIYRLGIVIIIFSYLGTRRMRFKSEDAPKSSCNKFMSPAMILWRDFRVDPSFWM